MIIKRLDIRNFRNYKKTSVIFDKGINMIIGSNGQGKTNLLESIYYLSCTRSHRVRDDKNLINKEDVFFNVEARVNKKETNINIKCIVTNGGKNLFLHNNPVRKVSDFIGEFNAVMFCPDDIGLFDGSPRMRRRFIDLELGKISKSYTVTLNEYNKVLKERNSLLKNDDFNQLFLETLNEKLIELQITIIKQRYKFLNDMLDKSKKFYTLLSGDNTNITCRYESFVDFNENKKKMYDEMINKYQNSYDRDIFLKQTNVGIHKDDYIFYMNDIPVTDFASQGQKRTILLSMKIGIVYEIYELTGEFPVLLLDDVFSELDEKRRERLIELLDDRMQIFITTTDLIKIKENLRKIHYFNVNDGNIKEFKEVF